MNGFWESDLGTVTGESKDAFVKSFKQIPDGTMALAKIETFLNADFDGFKYLAIEWILTDGDFKGQKVQQKLKVFGGDKYDKDHAKTKHRALNMFKLLYQIFNLKINHDDAPSDKDLSVFVGKIAGIRIRETEPNDMGRQYNWISEVHEAKGFKCETGISIVVTHDRMQQQSLGFEQGPIDSAFNRHYAKDELTNSDIAF